MKILREIKDSIYSPTYYASLSSTPISHSFRYYAKLVLILALIGAIVMGIFIGRSVRSFLQNGGEEIVKYYPADLELTLTDGKVTTTVTEPYFIPTPPHEGQGPLNLLVVDTKTAFTPDKFHEYDAGVWLMQDSFAVRDGSAIKIMPLDKVPNVHLDKQQVAMWGERFAPFIKNLATFGVPVLLFFALVFSGVVNLAYLLFAALLVWLLIKLAFKNPIEYKRAYQLALHAVTLPLVLSGGLALFHVWQPFKFGFTLLLLILVWLNLRKV